MTAVETVDVALRLARSRLAEGPGFPVYKSIVTQLEYVANVLGGQETNRSRLKEVMVGFYGVREFDDSDPELKDALVAAQTVVDGMVRGRLRV